MTHTPERKEELQCVAINEVPYVLFRQYVELEDRFKELAEQRAELLKSLKEVRIDYVEAKHSLQTHWSLQGLNSSGIAEKVEYECRLNQIEAKIFELNEVIAEAKGK